MYTATGWAGAEDALRAAEALARSDDERGGAACERGQLAYAATVLGIRDRADEARSALGRAAALLAPAAPGRPLLDFRRGLMAEHVADSPQSARAAYRRAHAGATARGDLLLLSSTWRHLAGLALRDGELAEARHGFAESLRIREELGFLVGTAPALVSLADAAPEAEAARLRAEAARLFRLMDGLPTWLAAHLPPAPAPGDERQDAAAERAEAAAATAGPTAKGTEGVTAADGVTTADGVAADGRTAVEVAAAEDRPTRGPGRKPAAAPPPNAPPAAPPVSPPVPAPAPPPSVTPEQPST